MASKIDTFTMKDGREVTVNWLCVKSLLKIKKKDWKEIREKLQELIDYVNSPQYEMRLRKSLGLDPDMVEWSANGRCLTIYRP